MIPVISFWSKGKAPIELIYEVVLNCTFTDKILQSTKSVSEWCLVSNASLAIDSIK